MTLDKPDIAESGIAEPGVVPDVVPGVVPDVVIVGGGVAGCTLAFELSRRGHKVTLLERDRVGHAGASAVPVALLNPNRGRSARASAFDTRALTSMWALVAELKDRGLEPGVHQTGVLRVAANAKQAKTWQTRPDTRWLEPESVPPEYHAPYGGMMVSVGGWLTPRTLLRALVVAAKRHGAVVYEHCRVVGLEPGRVITDRGVLRAQTVVLCSGADSVSGSVPGSVPGVVWPTLERVAGEVIGLTLPTPMPYPLAGAVYGAQVDTTFYLGGNHRPAEQQDESAPAQLQRAGGWFVPALKGAACSSVWTGVRAKTADNLPVVRELRPGLYFMGAFAGRGFLAAAHVSASLAARLALQP